MTKTQENIQGWMKERIREDEIAPYLKDGRDFIDDARIEALLRTQPAPDTQQLEDILARSMAVETLTPEETAALIHVENPDHLARMRETALAVKKKVYDNRIVTFAPLYLGNFCVNNCAYCGFKTDNTTAQRRVLSSEEIKKEVAALAGKIGHKRLIVVYGEHPRNDTDYIVDSIRDIYSVEEQTQHGVGNIRRVNVNAPPMSVADLKRLHEVGIGTYQVFQETYHHETYARVHPSGTIKSHYQWRLYCMHRAYEAGIDDFGIGALFGLYDWRFEVLGLLHHALDLEEQIGIGPHTVSFPRFEPALNVAEDQLNAHRVSDEDFKKVMLVLRLAIPYTGMIITARETARIRREAIELGITQTDASTRIGVGSYSETAEDQNAERQQFMLGDTRSLDEVIREYAEMGYITSFCTAGYRCGRTGKCIMELLRSGQEGRFCKLNAVLTFREWLDDFASEETRRVAEPVLNREIEEVRQKMPGVYPKFREYYERIRNGERDLYL